VWRSVHRPTNLGCTSSSGERHESAADHHQSARHRPLQVHHAAGLPASLSGATGEYHFKCRNRGQQALSALQGEIEAQIAHLCTLRFLPEELAYLRTLRFIKEDFVDYLELFQFRRASSASRHRRTPPGSW
jgi:hypothetical protein